jgi:hypothetical protein
MKAVALKIVVGLLGAFAVYYAFFLSSVLYELYGPNARWCATPQVWALQGGALFFAPPALLGSVALWFIGRRKDLVGIRFSRASKVLVAFLGLCAVANVVFLIPAL